ncbi:MAG TPA: hypothetical protein VL240_00245 [Candidatus Binatia bacterium]|nr:hypothetical protein [Candidatus Binatia bacterium]
MFLRFSGPIISLTGVVLGAYGTLLMCRPYHPFGTWGVFQHLLWIGGKVLTGDIQAAREAIREANDFSTVNRENRYRTVAGVYVLVFSFVVQTIGAVLILVDMVVRGS